LSTLNAASHRPVTSKDTLVQGPGFSQVASGITLRVKLAGYAVSAEMWFDLIGWDDCKSFLERMEHDGIIGCLGSDHRREVAEASSAVG
jgi:hypothetical protein